MARDRAFAHGFADTDTLSDVLKKQPGHASLSQLRDDHVAAGLEGKIRQHGS
jgi:hypothetical protein